MTIEAQISTVELAAVLGLTPRRVRQLMSAGAIPQAERGRVGLSDGVQGYVGWLREEERRTSKSASASRVQDARAREIELRIAREDGKIIELREHDEIFETAFGILKSRLLSVPAEVTRDRAVRDVIEDKIAAALNACCETFTRMGEDLAAGERPRVPRS